MSLASNILLLGLGNDLLTDDAIGLHVVREARRHLSGTEGVAFAETTEMGLALLDLVVGFESLVVLDAIQTGNAPPGSLHEMEFDDLTPLPPISPHFLGLAETLALGRELGLSVPRHVKILAIEVQDPFTVSTQMTPVLTAALPGIVKHVLWLPWWREASSGPQRAHSTPCRLRSAIAAGTN